MKKVILIASYCLTTLCANAQEKKSSWVDNVKLSGYGMTQLTNYNSITVMKVRNRILLIYAWLVFLLKGRIMNDFYWKTQIQFNETHPH